MPLKHLEQTALHSQSSLIVRRQTDLDMSCRELLLPQLLNDNNVLAQTGLSPGRETDRSLHREGIPDAAD